MITEIVMSAAIALTSPQTTTEKTELEANAPIVEVFNANTGKTLENELATKSRRRVRISSNKLENELATKSRRRVRI